MARGRRRDLLASVEDSETFRRATDVLVEDLESQPVAEMLASLVRAFDARLPGTRGDAYRLANWFFER